MKLAVFGAQALTKLKRMKRALLICRTCRRPKISDSGPMIKGPSAYARTGKKCSSTFSVSELCMGEGKLRNRTHGRLMCTSLVRLCW